MNLQRFPLCSSAFVLVQHLFPPPAKQRKKGTLSAVVEVTLPLSAYISLQFPMVSSMFYTLIPVWLSLWACSGNFCIMQCWFKATACPERLTIIWIKSRRPDQPCKMRLQKIPTYGTGESWQIGVLIIQTFHRDRAFWKEKQDHWCNETSTNRGKEHYINMGRQ